MPVTYDLESMDGVAVGVGRGELTLEEAKFAAETMWQRVAGPNVRMLWDLRDARFRLDIAQVHELGEFVKALSHGPGTRTAFVVSKDLEFGLVRVFEAMRETEGVQTRAFRDKDQAVEWLTAGDAR